MICEKEPGSSDKISNGTIIIMQKKKNSISKKSIIRLAVLGVILFIGTGLAAGTQMYRQNLEIFKNAANSYANMIIYQIGLVDINEILQNEENIRDIQASIESYIKENVTKEYRTEEDLDTEDRLTPELIEQYGEEAMSAFGSWSTVDSFVVGLGNICNDVRYAYVVIPEEEELIYIWDSEMTVSKLTVPFDRSAYSGKEKEHIIPVMRGEVLYDFFTDTLDGEMFGTVLIPVTDISNNICAVAAIDISISSIRSASFKLLLNIGIVILLGMLVSIILYHYVVRKQIIDPIVMLTQAVDGLVNNLREENVRSFYVDVNTGDEIEVLARSFMSMDEKLLDYIQENTAITAEKERIETELSLAARIQMGMLPSTFPPFPDRKEIDLYAYMKPARDVGGDFYDFFMIDDDRLGIVMADVSGKGIPAALFMMMSKIMVQNFALTLGGPKEVLEKVNNQICKNAEEEMFVTVWLGMLDLKTGLLTISNGGHEYPAVMMPGEEYKLFKDKPGLVVGGIEGYQYHEYQIQLEPGSRLFLYTDGLPEASNASGKMFGIERTLKALNEVRDGTCREVLDHVTQSVTAFVGDAPQFDDTTMLCLEYKG